MASLILDYYRLQNEPFEDYSSLLRQRPQKHWYPFEEGAAVLCLGTDSLQAICACRAKVTALERSFFKAQVFQELQDLTLYVGELCDIPLQGTFDYIAAEHPDASELALLAEHLKPEGKMLVVTDEANEEVGETLKALGFGYLRFYYLLSDGIYSDEQLPSLEEYLTAVTGERLVSEEEYKKAKAILTGKALSHFAPGKAVEAGRRDNLAEPVCRPVATETGKRVLPVDQDESLIAGVKAVQLSLLRELKRVCDENGLKLFLFYGSLLGAVRHRGYIPGDDDIDVALLRGDYDRLLSLADRFPGAMFLQTPSNDDCFYGGYTKLRDTGTAALMPQNWWKSCCEGISIDIFPLDTVCADARKEKRKQREILFLQRMLYAKAYGYFDRFLDMPLLPWKFYKYLGKPFSRERLAAALYRVMSRHDGTDGNRLGTYARYLGFQHQVMEVPASAYDNPVPLAFEDLELGAPYGYLNILKALYGESFLQQPPWNEYKTRHGFYSLDCPAAHYKTRFSGLLKPIPDKEIVLFGDRELFRIFREKYPGMPVADTVVLGEDPLPPPAEERYAVICAADVRRAERLLQEAGYRDYYFFWARREWMLRANVSSIWNDVEQG